MKQDSKTRFILIGGFLGAGKTTFARAFIKALAASEEEAKEEVPSPTFSLVQVYPRQPADVWHIDLYRIEHIDEILELGLDEALADGILLIEWPERMGKLLPAERLDLRFEFAERSQGRRVRLEPASPWHRRIREALSNE